MRLLPTKLHYALHASAFIAYHGSAERPLSGAAITTHYKLKKRALEPVLQCLSKAGILASIQGHNGGYYVPSPHKVSLKHILECFLDGPLPDEAAFVEFTPLLQPHMDASHASWLESLSSITLSDLCKDAQQHNIAALETEVLDYTI